MIVRAGSPRCDATIAAIAVAFGLVSLAAICLGPGEVRADAIPAVRATETWPQSTDPAGWYQADPDTFFVVATSNGNPGPFAFARTENASGGIETASGPWTGDYHAGDIEAISFDVQYFATTQNARLRLHDPAGGAWEFVFAANGAVDGQWHDREISIDPIWSDADAIRIGWQAVGSSTPWSEVLRDVAAVSVEADAGSWFGIDNFELRRRTTVLRQLFAIDGGAGNEQSNLLRLDPGDGSVAEVIGPVGLAVEAMTFDPLSGQLIGAVSTEGTTSSNQLVRIDPRSGTTTSIGTLSWPLGFESASFSDLTFDRHEIGLGLKGWADPPSGDGGFFDIDLSTAVVDDDFEPFFAANVGGGLTTLNDSFLLTLSGVSNAANPGDGELLSRPEGILPGTPSDFLLEGRLTFDDAGFASAIEAMTTLDGTIVHGIATEGPNRWLMQFAPPDLEASKLGTLPANTEALAWQTCTPRPGIPNGGFHTQDLKDWKVIGNVSIVDFDYVDYTLPSSRSHALLATDFLRGSAAPPVDGDALAKFVGVAPEELETALGYSVEIQEGSAIQVSFEAEAGDRIYLWYTFLTSEPTPTLVTNDFSFVDLRRTPESASPLPLVVLDSTLSSDFEASTTRFAEQRDPTNGPITTSHSTWETTLSETGTYTLTIGVTDVFDEMGGSAIVVDWARLIRMSLGREVDAGGILECTSQPPAPLPTSYADLDPDRPTMLELTVVESIAPPRPGVVFDISNASAPEEIQIHFVGCRVPESSLFWSTPVFREIRRSDTERQFNVFQNYRSGLAEDIRCGFVVDPRGQVGVDLEIEAQTIIPTATIDQTFVYDECEIGEFCSVDSPDTPKFNFVSAGIESFSWVEDGFQGQCTTTSLMQLNYAPQSLPPGPGWDCCTYTYVEIDSVESEIGQVLIELNNPGPIPPIPDIDGDGIHDDCDNCPYHANRDQVYPAPNGPDAPCPEPGLAVGIAACLIWLSALSRRRSVA